MAIQPFSSNIHFDASFPLMFGTTGAWQVYRYQNVRDILFDFDTYGNGYMPDNGLLGSNLNQTDPPLHGQFRGLISGYFSRSAVTELEPFISDMCQRLLEGHSSGSVDFARNFAFPLTAAIICKILGIPSPEHSKINDWAKAIVSAGYAPEGPQRATQAQQEMSILFLQLLAARKAAPEGDLLSALAAAEIDGIPVSPPVQIGTCMTILLAGFETTANLISQSIYQLSLDSSLQQVLRKSPWKIPQLLLEVLRLHPSIVSMYRIARKEVRLEGVVIKEGDIVNGWINTANRDPEIFPEPDKLDLERANSSQALSFGYGIHHCVGAVLARTQARIALEVLLERSNFRLSNNDVPQRTPSLITPGFQTMPIIIEKK
jgi:cytochrome P450